MPLAAQRRFVFHGPSRTWGFTSSRIADRRREFHISGGCASCRVSLPTHTLARLVPALAWERGRVSSEDPALPGGAGQGPPDHRRPSLPVVGRRRATATRRKQLKERFPVLRHARESDARFEPVSGFARDASHRLQSPGRSFHRSRAPTSPRRRSDELVAEGEGVRVVLAARNARAVRAEAGDDAIGYRGVYPSTDVLHVAQAEWTQSTCTCATGGRRAVSSRRGRGDGRDARVRRGRPGALVDDAGRAA